MICIHITVTSTIIADMGGPLTFSTFSAEYNIVIVNTMTMRHCEISL